MPDPFEQAKQLHEAGKLDEAEAAYRAVLDNRPDDFKVLNNLGVLLEERGRLADATECYERAIEAEPSSSTLHYNLGHALQRQLRLNDALAAYKAALDLEPDLVAAQFNLANVLYEQGRLESAEVAFGRTVELAPELLQGHSNLGSVLFDRGRFHEAADRFRRVLELNDAIASEHFNLGKTLDLLGQAEGAETAYRRAVALDPDTRIARENLARLLYRSGREEDAVEVFDEWLRHAPGDPVAQHMLAACTGRGAAPRASDEYVRAVFDQFAGDFELTLHKLRYRAPSLLAEALGDRIPSPDGTRDVVDLGCGTGLCGPLLKQYARRLVGVDLSEGMLERARAKGVYDELVAEELTGYLQRRPRAFDLAVSADTFVYFGDLEPVLAAAAAALKPGGLLAFTVEALAPDASPEPFRLEPQGRYAHAREHVAERLRGSGFEALSLEAATLRRESGRPVEGLVVVARSRGD